MTAMPTVRHARGLGRLALTIALGLTAALSSACSSTAETSREAALLREDTQVCVQNFTRTTPTVTFGVKDSSFGEGPLPQDTRACASGYRAINPDIEGEIDLTSASGRKYSFSGDNPSVGEPQVEVWSLELNKECLQLQSLGVGGKATYDDGRFALVFTRLADTDKKEFTLDITDSANPTSDGSLRPCP